MNEFERFTADVHNAFELLGGKKSYDSFVALISASARQDEQERIIKLLVDNDWNIAQCCFQPNCCLDTERLIALIKGENK